MQKYAVIVGGGSGQRMGTELPKQFLLLHNKPVLWYTVDRFLSSFDDLSVVLVLPAAHIERGYSIIASMPGAERVTITAGGNTRFQSVKNGLEHVRGNAVVFVHDAVRCLVTHDLIQRCYDAAIANGNAVPAVPVNDSLRLVHNDGSEIMDRSRVRIIQTPQTFLSDILLSAFRQFYHASFTDEAAVVEKTGVRINLVEGETTNIKITHPVDLILAEKILHQTSS